MSVFLLNSDTEVDVDSPAAIGSVQNPNMSEASQALLHFWPKATEEIRKIGQLDVRSQALPLARIKKIMKLDEEVKMISAEAPVLFAKAAELFIHELTLRAWVHTEDNKRRTLQRNDIAMAITKYDQFDFLIDIVPRDEVKPTTHHRSPTTTSSQSHDTRAINAEQVHYYFQLAQQHQAAMAQQTGGSQATQAIQVIPPTQIQAVTIPQQPTEHIIKHSAGTQLQTSSGTTSSGGIQLVQQIVTPTGEVQQIPIQLTASQMQMIRMQLQNSSGQPIIIQTAPLQAQPHVIQVTQQNASTPVFIQSTGGNSIASESE